jgi:hypothetical protein
LKILQENSVKIPKILYENPEKFLGVTIASLILVGAPVSGASMNPARSLGPAVAANYWVSHWIYWVGPIVGALAGLILWLTMVKPTIFMEAMERETVDLPGEFEKLVW